MDRLAIVRVRVGIAVDADTRMAELTGPFDCHASTRRGFFANVGWWNQ